MPTSWNTSGKPSFAELFKALTGDHPFPYQERFAESDHLPEILHAPTGAGKTATVVLGWAWRYFHTNRKTPRRLVYCLPMRVLVEQTANVTRKWLDKAALSNKVDVHALMGGEEAEEWDLDPEKPAILIGTQDMLLSRALNRGYGMKPYRWPMHFGLLNNDCMWVLDEIQLMGVGLATSTQLQAFRDSLGVYGAVQTIWMSATLLPDWLASVDLKDRVKPTLKLTTLALDHRDFKFPGFRERWEAGKPLSKAISDRTNTSKRKKAAEDDDVIADDSKTVAQFVASKHQVGSLTLVIVNRVDRAQNLLKALQSHYVPAPKRRKKGTPVADPAPQPDLRLIHSRFRPRERDSWREWLTEGPEAMQANHSAGRIIVATQVVEAGVDLSAQTLITELAPWPSLAQRFGRCNRRGEFVADNPAQVHWIDVPTPDDKKASPYSKDELDESRRQLMSLTDVGPKTLAEFFDRLSDDERKLLFPFDPPHVIRRKDFVDLFDTTPDLAGNDIDVSRFIRDGEEIDVQVFWRATCPPKTELTASEARSLSPRREELCAVKVGDFRDFVDDHTAYRWDAFASTWAVADAASVYPGQIYWVPAEEGGYDVKLGWNPSSKWSTDLWLHEPSLQSESEATEEHGYDTELLSLYGWQSIAEHTDGVVTELKSLLVELGLGDIPRDALELAARWHDWGKSHVVFQNAIRDDIEGAGKRPSQWTGKRDIAKAAPQTAWRRYRRKHFRHELASALGVLTLLKNGQLPEDWRSIDSYLTNLSLYLIAAHHGKVRLSIRSMPDECIPDNPDALFARGVWAGDELASVDLGGNILAPAVAELDLSPMLLGQVDEQPSWAERMLKLRDAKNLGLLRLSFLETLIRAADIRASKAADRKAKGEQS